MKGKLRTQGKQSSELNIIAFLNRLEISTVLAVSNNARLYRTAYVVYVELLRSDVTHSG